MSAIQPRPEQRSRDGQPPAMFTEAPRRGPFRTWYGQLATCPVHWWSGPNVAVADDDSSPICWEGGHVIDLADVLRAAR